MPLSSKIFAGDKALEACLVSDPAHVMPGASGEHVRKIQIALGVLDGAVIDDAELSAARNGKSTTQAILTYKTRRKIINLSYQTAPDNIVGKMTIASLDKEMLAYEQSKQGPQYVHCDFGAHKRRFMVRASPFLKVSDTSPSMRPREEALNRKQDAINWVIAAKAYLQTARSLMPPALNPDLNKLMTMDEWRALVTHFKFDKHPNPQQYLIELGSAFSKMHIVLTKAETYFVDDLVNTTDFAYAPLGGWGLDMRISICPNYCGKGRLFQTAVIVHETAHFVDEKIDHFASELPKMDGTPVNGAFTVSGVNYAQMSASQAQQNAYSYAQFALHAYKKEDYRITPFNE